MDPERFHETIQSLIDSVREPLLRALEIEEERSARLQAQVDCLLGGRVLNGGMVPSTGPEPSVQQSKEKAGAATPAPNQDRTEGV